MFDIPSIREYFIDLDHVLGVISDGPAKSIAYRRLRYLASKFEMYSLLNESQELAAMKVRWCHCHVVPSLCHWFRASLTGQDKLQTFFSGYLRQEPTGISTMYVKWIHTST